MPDPIEQLNQLDIQNLPPEEAAKLLRAHAAALQQQQRHALLGMLGTVPELQEAGKAEYGQAGKERESNLALGGAVLKQTLGEKEASARLKELENQGLYQRGMLSVALGNLGLGKIQQEETKRKNVEEERIRDIMTKPTVPSKILEGLSEDERRLAQLDALKEAIPALGWAFDLAKQPIQASHEATKKTVSGYRAMGAQGLPAEAPVPGGPTAVRQAAPKIHVRNKQTGEKGYVSPQVFDSFVGKYEKIP